MKRFSQPGTVHTYGFSPGEVEKLSVNGKQGFNVQELKNYYVLKLRLNTGRPLCLSRTPSHGFMTHYKLVGTNQKNCQTDVKGLTSVYPHMVLVVGGTGE